MRKRTSKKVYQCVKQTSKKYTSRPSPPYSAADCPNQIKTGNDGKKYISMPSYETGIYKWILYSKELIKKKKEELEEIIRHQKIRMRELSKKNSKRTSKRSRSKKSSKK
jgi:hypothetical protein